MVEEAENVDENVAWASRPCVARASCPRREPQNQGRDAPGTHGQDAHVTSGPLSLRVSVTDRCRFGCLYCTPAGGVERFAPADVLSYEEILGFVRLLKARWGLSKVHLTGGEPLDRREIVGLVGMLAGEGLADLAVTTNAQRMPELAGDLWRAGLRRVNISLHSLRAAAYRRITGQGELARTLEGIEAARGAGLAIKLNMTVLRGLNADEAADVAQFGLAKGAEVRFIELMPLGPAAGHYAEWFVPADEILAGLRTRFDLQELPRVPGGSSRPYRATGPAGHSGVLGLIAPCSQPFCADCNRLRLTANGELLGCLAKPGRQSILAMLRKWGLSGFRNGSENLKVPIFQTVAEVLGHKRHGEGFTARACMVKVGG